MVVDELVRHIVSDMWYKWLLVVHEEWFILYAPSQCGEIIEKANTFDTSSNIFSLTIAVTTSHYMAETDCPGASPSHIITLVLLGVNLIDNTHIGCGWLSVWQPFLRVTLGQGTLEAVVQANYHQIPDLIPVAHFGLVILSWRNHIIVGASHVSAAPTTSSFFT